MLAIRAGQMFDGESFSTGGGTVVIENGRIAGVEAGWPDLPADTQILDHPDGTVLPGLIDCHAHLVCDSSDQALDRVAGYTDDAIDAVITEGLRRQLAAGVTTVRDLGDRGFAVLERRDRQRSGTSDLPEPTIVAAGPPLTSPRGHCFYLGGEVGDRDQIAAAVQERAERAVDIVKVMASGGMATPGTDVLAPQFPLEDLRFLVDRAHAAGLPVTAHAHALSAVEQAIDAGVDGIEHCSCMSEKGVELSDELLRALVSSGIVVSGFIPVPANADMSHAPPAVREMMARRGLTPEQLAEIRLTWLGRLHRAGVRLVTGPDSGIGSELAHGGVSNAVAFLVAAGASTADGLAAATALAADACGFGDRKGLLRKGYDADLVVVGGELNADIGVLSDVRSVVLGGSVVS